MQTIRHVAAKNRHSVLLLFLSAAIFIGAADLTSGPSGHIGFVSLQRVSTESTAAQAIARRLDALREERRRAIADKQKQLEAVRLQLANAGGLFQASRRAQLRRDEERLRVELPQVTEQAQTEIQNLQRQLQGELRGQLESVINEIAARHRVDLVLNLDAAVVWNRGAQDLTAETIKNLNARDGAAKPAK